MLRRFLTGLACVAALVLAVSDASVAGVNRWGADYFPNLDVVTQDGKTLHFYDDLIKGKIVIVNFIYTSCAELCPIETARLAEAKDKLGDAVGRDIFFVSISVDPEHDTPEMLKAYADAFDAKSPGWQFITGKPSDMKQISEKFGDRSAQRTLSDHRNEILIGNDATADWERDSAFADVNQLVTTIHLMDPTWSDKADVARGNTLGSAYAPLGDQAGQALFKKMCAPCHTVGGGDHVGPDLAGVADRHDHAWLTDFIMNPEAMLARKDPDALALSARFPGVHMPQLGLLPIDVDDVLSYVRAQTSRPSARAKNISVPKQAAK